MDPRWKVIPWFAVFSLCLPLQAGPVFEEDFQSAPDPAGLTQWRGTKDRVAETDGAWFEVVADAENLFGGGAENRVLALHDRSDASQINLSAKVKGAEDVITVGFDFLEPPDASAGPAVFRIGTAGNEPTEVAVNLVLRDGTFENDPEVRYATGEKHRLTVVVNNSPSPVPSDGTSLPSQHYDLFLDGRRIRAAVPFDTQDGVLPAGAVLDALRLLTYSSVTKDQTFFIDNIRVENGAHQP